jgi:RNA recognition motif-containing protein
MQATPQGDYQIYVGNLDQNVNNSVLLGFFSKKYDSLTEAKVISDPVTKISKGYGFLRFSQQHHATACLAECQGHYIMTKPIKLNNAAQRKSGQEDGNQ